MTGTDLADTLLLHLRALRLPLPVREYRALPDRRFRCDLAWPDRMLTVEVDGGELTHGRHNRAQGMASDCEKQNLLVLAGWHVLRFTGGQVKAGLAIPVVTEALRRFPPSGAHGPTLQEAHQQIATLADHYGHGWLAGRQRTDGR